MQGSNRTSSAQDLHARDVALPGLWQQRKREVKELEEHAGAPGGCCPAWPSCPSCPSCPSWAKRTCRSLADKGVPFRHSSRRHLRCVALQPAGRLCARRALAAAGPPPSPSRGQCSSGGNFSKCSPLCAVMWVSWLNRGTNFSLEERDELRLEGLLPPVVESLDLQAGNAVKIFGTVTTFFMS